MRYRWSDRTLSYMFFPKCGVFDIDILILAIYRVPLLHHKKGVFTISWYHPSFMSLFL